MDRLHRGAPALVKLLAALAVSGAVSAQDQPPRFRADVDLISLDVTVLDGAGRPVLGLAPQDFTVRIGGSPRRVITADWIPLTEAVDRRGQDPAFVPLTFSSNVNSPPGRILLIAIDQQNIRFGGGNTIRDALVDFVDRLQPADRIGLLILGRGGQNLPFTADREAIKAALSRFVGQKLVVQGFRRQIAVWEALAIHKDDSEVFRAVVLRECGAEPGQGGSTVAACIAEVQSQAASMAVNAVDDGVRMLSALRSVFEAMRAVDAPKSLVLATEGFVLDESRTSFGELERLAAESRVSLYALRLDQRVMDGSLRGAGSPGSAGMDRLSLREGLDQLANVTRGRVFNVVTTPDAALRSIELELSGYYLLGVESDPSDRSERARGIEVAVGREGVTVRTRRQVVADAAPRTARDLAARALASPLPNPAVPIQVGTFSLGGQEPGKIQLLIRAEIGDDYTSPGSMLVGYLVIGEKGQIVESRGVERELRPAVSGVPSPLEFTTTISVDPGEYLLRLAASDGRRVGSVERKVSARLGDAGAVKLSDLGAGGPVQVTNPLQPTLTWSVAFGNLHAFLEAYGVTAPKTTVRYEIARSGEMAALLGADTLVRPVGDDRAIFTRVIPVGRLPPGRYILRAIVQATGCNTTSSLPRACTLTSDFVIPESPAPAPGEMFLPVDELAGRLAPPAASSIEDDRAAAWRRVETLVANRQLGAARDLLEESHEKWPDAVHLFKPLALVYATFGRSADAVQMLQRYVAARPDDVDALGLAVEWLYTLRRAGAGAPNHAQLAREYAAAYQKLDGRERALVQLWLEHIERR